MENRLIKKLANGEKPIGMFVGSCSETVVECLGRTGIDYIIIDNEHSPAEAETTAKLVRAAELSGITPLARVREISRPGILKLLDVGVKGLIIPNVKSVEDVKKIVSFAKFSPIGNRGFCPTRKDGWGFDCPGSVADSMCRINAETLVIPQCETAEALACIEDIAAVEGVDGIFIGPFDLSIAMGIPGMMDLPEFKAAKKRILEASHANSKPCFLFSTTPENTASGFAEGFDSMTFSNDTVVIIESIREKVEKIRSL